MCAPSASRPERSSAPKALLFACPAKLASRRAFLRLSRKPTQIGRSSILQRKPPSAVKSIYTCARSEPRNARSPSGAMQKRANIGSTAEATRFTQKSPKCYVLGPSVPASATQRSRLWWRVEHRKAVNRRFCGGRKSTKASARRLQFLHVTFRAKRRIRIRYIINLEPLRSQKPTRSAITRKAVADADPGEESQT